MNPGLDDAEVGGRQGERADAGEVDQIEAGEPPVRRPSCRVAGGHGGAYSSGA